MSDGRMTATADVHRLECSVDWPPGNAAGYLVDGSEPVLVDAGMAGPEPEDELAAALAEQGREFADIEHVLLTHPHTDHVGQVPTVLEAADPEVYAPVGIRERLQRGVDELEAAVRTNGRAAGLTGSFIETAVDTSVDSLERNRDLLPPASVDHWLAAGEEIVIGPLTVETVHTPGHQGDHFCYLSELADERVLFSGDMALDTFRPIALHAGFDHGYEGAIDAFYTALERLAALDVDRVFTGHGDPHTDFAAALERDREELDHLLEATVEAVPDDGTTTALDIALQRSEKQGKAMSYRIIETASAAAKLAADGKLTDETDDGIRHYERA